MTPLGIEVKENINHAINLAISLGFHNLVMGITMALPLIISGMGDKSTDLYEKTSKLVRGLKPRIIVESNDKEFDENNEEYDNINLGTEIHKIFELEDFNTTTNKFVLSFLNKIDKNSSNKQW